MAFSIVRLKMSDEFLDQDEHYRFNWVQEWCEQYLQPVLAALDPDLNTFFGGDFARSGLTVNCILQQQPDLKLHTPLMVELRNVAFDCQKQIYIFIADSLPRFQCGALDARGNGQYLAESMMLLYGENIKQVMLSPKWYLENMPRFKAHFEDKTL
ncbi:MAG: hypothetical protein GY862_09970, partial [Gammaproteobacteria bacterium]|nr:hypothetical protein [Gammaproteobacteria bacterium]